MREKSPRGNCCCEERSLSARVGLCKPDICVRHLPHVASPHHFRIVAVVVVAIVAVVVVVVVVLVVVVLVVVLAVVAVVVFVVVVWCTLVSWPHIPFRGSDKEAIPLPSVSPTPSFGSDSRSARSPKKTPMRVVHSSMQPLPNTNARAK